MLDFLLTNDENLKGLQRETIVELDIVMGNAFNNAKYSNCLKKQVGAVLTPISFLFTTLKKDSIKKEGNGYGGWIHSCSECLRKTLEWQQDGCWSMHSEPRAIFDYFNKYGFKQNLSDMVMVVTHGPCDQCLKYCAFFGIQNIVYATPYHNDYTKWSGIIDVYELERENKTLIKRN